MKQILRWYDISTISFFQSKGKQNLEKNSPHEKYEKASQKGTLTYSVTSDKINYRVYTQMLNENT